MNFKKLSIISNTPTTITKQEQEQQEQQQQQLIDYQDLAIKKFGKYLNLKMLLAYHGLLVTTLLKVQVDKYTHTYYIYMN